VTATSLVDPRLALLACIILAATPLAAAEIRTVAGSGEKELSKPTLNPVKNNIGQPFGVELDRAGNLYITEVWNHRIWRLDRKSGKIKVVAGNGKKGYSGDGGDARQARLNEPYEVRFDKYGNMIFVEMQNHLIRRVDAKTGKISTIAGTGKAGFAGDGGPARRAQFKVPHSLALDDQGNIYVADIGNHRIRRIDAKTQKIETIAGNGKRRLPRDGQLAKGKPMLGPRALFVAGTAMWIALREGHSVWKMELESGRLKHVAGSGKRGFSGDGGDPKQATFNGPKGIAVGPRGAVYVVDTENQTIRKIDLKKNRITTVAGRGPKARGGKGDGGPATKAELDRPHGVCVGPDGKIYIGDTLNHRVRVVLP